VSVGVCVCVCVCAVDAWRKKRGGKGGNPCACGLLFLSVLLASLAVTHVVGGGRQYVQSLWEEQAHE